MLGRRCEISGEGKEVRKTKRLRVTEGRGKGKGQGGERGDGRGESGEGRGEGGEGRGGRKCEEEDSE